MTDIWVFCIFRQLGTGQCIYEEIDELKAMLLE